MFDTEICNQIFSEKDRYKNKYKDKFVIIKFGGELVAKPDVLRSLLMQAVHLKSFGARILLVNGGGSQINADLKKNGIKTIKHEDGTRYTQPEAMDIIARCLNDLSGNIIGSGNDEIKRVGANHAKFVGLEGSDCCGFIEATAKFEKTDSRTGKVKSVDVGQLTELCSGPNIPVINSVCMGDDGGKMNVNADDLAAGIAIYTNAARLILCTNLPGVLDNDKKRIPELDRGRAEELIEQGVISEGLVPKVSSCIDVVDAGVDGVVILDGNDGTSVEKEILSDEGAGTLFRTPEGREREHMLDWGVVPV